jgi:iron complex outermembrane receptor protein
MSVLALSAAFAAPAFAQAPQAAQAADDKSDDQTIVVTGSIFRNPSTSTAAPLTVLSAEELEKRGVNNLSDAIQSISANNAGSMSKSWNSFNFATGATAVSLRGLGSGNTVTLFDGLRSAPYPLADDGHRNFVDLNALPASVVERIDVLQDGASATYGADAVAGVVNVVIKKEITGFHANASAGISQRGDAGERRISASYGYGKLDENGFNIYVAGEYQKNDPLFARDRGHKWNTADLSSFCNTSGSCLSNGVVNGVQSDGTILSIGSTRVPVLRPYSSTSTPAGDWILANPAAGCRDLKTITLTAAQQSTLHATPTQCQQDNVNQYLQEQPMIERKGATIHGTVNVGENAQAYALFNFFDVKTSTMLTPLTFAGQTAAGGDQFTLSPVFLPVYVCPRGTVTCTAANGTLNPNNPFASSGNLARVNYRYDRPRETFTDAKTYRAAAGINGSFGQGWNYDASFTWSRVDLKVTNKNYLFAQHLVDVINDGSYNFINPAANSEAIRDYIAPVNVNKSKSELWQVQGTLAKELFDLPGGAFKVAVGAAYRHEEINNPSANPPNNANPAERYYSINAVGAIGSRNVKSGFFEIDAPVFDQLSLNASGRYDKYSSGQKNFSPKITAIVTPIEQVKLRGTFSKGFRIPSFNEAYGLPTTGYITTTIDPATPEGAAYIAAHEGNAYATLPYSYGLTATGNSSLKPEKSTSYTLGLVVEPSSRFSFTADYWHIKIKGLIGSPDYSAIADLYYQQNGVVNVPGIVVKPGIPDPDHPNALPALGFIEYSFINSDSQVASGLDFSATGRFPIGSNMTLTSRVDASYLLKLSKMVGGTVQKYAGTLSPCDVTSCSGAPRWRGTWSNTLDFGDRASINLTAYYTGGYDMASIDYGGVKGDCDASLGASVYTYRDGTAFKCKAKRFIDVDFTASVKVADRFTLYTNILNLFDVKPDFNPGQTYSVGYNYNVAWEGQGFTGRYFRVGAKVDF